ncbi:MAG: hypothetical protein Q4B54_02365 [Coriobacteriales bacterium]|nr:hypothetical protein [Coriobacteriales bacterium]
MEDITMSALMDPDYVIAIMAVLMMLIPVMTMAVLKPEYKHEDVPTNRANQAVSSVAHKTLLKEYGLTENDN